MNKTLAHDILDQADEVSHTLSTLAHPARLRVLCLLLERSKCVGELTAACKLSQPAMSQLLGRMREDGLLRSSRDGTRMLYELADPRMVHLLRALKHIYC